MISSMDDPDKDTTHFGYETVSTKDKQDRVGAVFSSVADNYDIMNDLMSLGVHRLWKRFTINKSQLRPGHKALDLAGGSGDLTASIAPVVGETGHVTLSDINADMLRVGRDRLLNEGIYKQISVVQANAESLPFPSNHFDRVFISFGLRNVTHKQTALQEMYRVLAPGGQLLVLEFSTPVLPGLKPLYDMYSFNLLPWLGKVVAKDEASYRYLAESIRKHPDQETLLGMLKQTGLDNCQYHNLTGGIVALHRGYKY